MFRIHMLPAYHGDCLWLEFGNMDHPRFILIDGGTPSTWPALKKKVLEVRGRLGGKLHIELLVITHIDADHIGGAIKLLEQLSPLKITIGDVWFNGYHHLDNKQSPDVLGAKQGEQLSALIQEANLQWNKAFARHAVVVPETGPLPSVEIHDMKLTLLSPTFEALQKLKPKWEAEVRRAGLIPGEAYEVIEARADSDILGERSVAEMANAPFKEDSAEANAASIAFLAEFEGKRVFFGADSHPNIILQGLKRGPLNGSAVFPVSAFKVSHHGSKGNTDQSLLEALPARHYLVSTNGDQFQHPDAEAIARIAVFGPKGKKLHFNYKTKFNSRWTNDDWRWHYTASYGDEDSGLSVDL